MSTWQYSLDISPLALCAFLAFFLCFSVSLHPFGSGIKATRLPVQADLTIQFCSRVGGGAEVEAQLRFNSLLTIPTAELLSFSDCINNHLSQQTPAG